MVNDIKNPLSSLRWYRLSAVLINIRSSPAMTAHPFTVFQAIIKGVSTLAGFEDEAAVFFHIRDRKHTYRMKEADRLFVDVFFCRKSSEEVNKWREAFRAYLSDPVSGKNFDILELGEVEERSYDLLLSEAGQFPEEGEIGIEFLTPFPFRTEKERQRTYITRQTFLQSFEKRFSRLFGEDIKCKCEDNKFTILPYYWHYTEIRHLSHSQPGNLQYINGCAGMLYIKGMFKDLLPILILGSELHTGIKLSNAQGYYKLHKEPSGYFKRYFPNQKVITSVIRDVINRYDNALESLTAQEKFPFNEEKYAEELFEQIEKDTYTPSPNTAFLIKKKSGVERMVEQLDFRDLIVQQYILKTIADVFDRMFEEGSLGFRKGISRQKSVDMVQAAISEGYQYVIESDIEDFFPSVDLNILKRLLDSCIPQNDICLKSLIRKSVRNGYVLKGKHYERTKGLAQGSPLSPILANLYLDSFDEQIKQWDVKMIRYADDFIILAKTKEDAENVLSKTETFLSELGLKIKKEKTSIKHIKDGFQFLGMRFERSEVRVEPEEEIKRLKKPLYITEPYLFLSLNGDAVDIKKDRIVIETIPFRRISEIMVMEKTVFSTAFVSKCTENNIPFTIALNTGYYVTTIKPDSKKYYDISFEQGRRYNSLTDTEILSIAKEFAAGKINNYISFFKQKYVKDQNLFIGELERVVKYIYQAGDLNEVRGYEGSTAKKIYQRLNDYIDDTSFHIVKRDRKNPDRINSLLNFGYYLLFSRINATVRAGGLNPYLGFLHNPEDNYESFVCDIEELFRPRIDRLIIRLINLKAITKEDFTETERGFYLKKEAVKSYLNQYEAEMERKNTKNTLSLKESIYVQTAIFKNYFLENKPLTFYAWNV
jgi:group II intron reverse transcriptase/maturase/CRISPR-associated endonuclease Cas1